jgi:hypothetical protein
MVRGQPGQKVNVNPSQQTSGIWWLTSVILAIQEDYHLRQAWQARQKVQGPI